MSYEPTTWDTGDVITAEKMNHLEQGVASGGSVATVCVNFNGGGIAGSVFLYVTHAEYNSTLGNYSIESPMSDYYGSSPYSARFYVPVPLPPSGDGFKAFVCFNDFIDNMAAYTCSGGVSSTKVEMRRRNGTSAWESEPYYGFEVTGDGTIELAYED